MATLYIMEHSSVNMHEAPMPALPSIVDQAVTISGTSAQSAALFLVHFPPAGRIMQPAR